MVLQLWNINDYLNKNQQQMIVDYKVENNEKNNTKEGSLSPQIFSFRSEKRTRFSVTIRIIQDAIIIRDFYIWRAIVPLMIN